MTVRLLVDWKDPATGREYRVGNLLTTDAATESGLVGAKLADADTTGGTAWIAPAVPEAIDDTRSAAVGRDSAGNDLFPVLAATDPITGERALSAGADALGPILPEIANYAALRAYSGPVTAYYVRGVASLFDGGAGVFRVDSADTTSADNGGTVLVDASGRRWGREFSGAVNVLWFGVKGDFAIGVGGTDNAAAFAAAAAACKAGRYKLCIPSGSYYSATGLLFDDINVEGEDAYGVTLYFDREVTAVTVTGSRRKLSNLNIWFLFSDPAPSGAIGVQFGANISGTSTDQFSNCLCEHLYVRNAYRSYVTNAAGSSGTVWNNTFINCRADFPVDYAWHFDSIVGSTTQTWINCMVDGVVNDPLRPSKGWYVDSIDDVMWFNCQADDMYDGSAIYVSLSSKATVKNFRSEACFFRTNASQLLYLNARDAEVSGVKLQASTVMVGAGNRASIVRFGANGSGEVGGIVQESISIESGDFYKVDTNGTAFGTGKVVIRSAGISRSEVRRDDAGERTVFSNKFGKFGVNNSDPTVGTFEVGDHFYTVAVGANRSEYGKLCVTSGTAGTLSGVTGTTTAGSRLVTFNSTTNLREGGFITIAGVSGVKRIVHIKSSTQGYIDSDASATVADAAVAWSAPAFTAIGLSAMQATAMYAPPSLADGEGVTTTITVAGAALGDLAVASFSLDLQGVGVTAYVSAANTVSVRFQNESGAAKELASGTLRARVIKA